MNPSDIQNPGAVYIGNQKVLCRLIMPADKKPDVMLIVDANDRLLVPRLIMDGRLEPGGTNFVLNSVKPDFHCVDVGGNLGYFTCLLGRLAWRGKVRAIEADPVMHAQLHENITINWIAHTAQAINVAAADKPGKLTLYRRLQFAGNTGLSSHGFTPEAAKENAFEVAAITVDSLLPELGGRCDFLKVDVEGAEPLVFAGAKELIAKNRQIKILFEWSPKQIELCGFQPSVVPDIMAGIGLKPFDLDDNGTPTPTDWAQVKSRDYANLAAMF